MATLIRGYESLFDNVISAAHCLETDEFEHEKGTTAFNTPRKHLASKRVDDLTDSVPTNKLRKAPKTKRTPRHEIRHGRLDLNLGHQRQRSCDIDLCTSDVENGTTKSHNKPRFNTTCRSPKASRRCLNGDLHHISSESSEPFDKNENLSSNNHNTLQQHHHQDYNNDRSNNKDNSPTNSLRHKASSIRSEMKKKRSSFTLTNFTASAPQSTTEFAEDENDRASQTSQVGGLGKSVTSVMTPPIELLVEDQVIVQDWRKAKRKHDTWTRVTTARTVQENTALPARVTAMLNSRDGQFKTLELPCGRDTGVHGGRDKGGRATGVNAFNDSQDLYKAISTKKTKEQKHHENLEKVAQKLTKRTQDKSFTPLQVKNILQGKNKKVPVNSRMDLAMTSNSGPTSSVAEYDDINYQVVNEDDIASPTSHTSSEIAFHESQLDLKEKEKVPEYKRKERILPDIVGQVVANAEADTLRKRQRLGKRREAQGLVAVVDFYPERPLDRHIESRPEWVHFNVNRVIEEIRFELPFDLATLHSMTPLVYLTKYTKLSKNLRELLTKSFNKQLEPVKDRKKVLMMSVVGHRPSDILNTDQQKPRTLHCKKLYSALQDILEGGTLGQENFHVIRTNILDAEPRRLTHLTLDQYLGVAAYCQRKFWSMYANKEENEVFRPMLEILDFSNLRRKLGHVTVYSSLRTLFNSIAGRRTTEESNVDHFWQ